MSASRGRMQPSPPPKNPNFVLNQPRYQGAQVLLTRANFGCGSSREHAPWALLDFGFKAIIAESFADIFFNNCFKNGILPIVLPANEIEALFAAGRGDAGLQAGGRPAGAGGDSSRWQGISFQIDAFRKECLLNGWDDIGLTLRHAEKIREFRRKAPHRTALAVCLRGRIYENLCSAG
jgi:3-isopropylmalate/(R)-2-methylmalate dehydratase small subunit